MCADRCFQGGGAVQAWSIIEAGMVEQVQNLGATGVVEQAIVANPGSVIPPQAKDILALDTTMLTHAASMRTFSATTVLPGVRPTAGM